MTLDELREILTLEADRVPERQEYPMTSRFGTGKVVITENDDGYSEYRWLFPDGHLGNID